MAPSRHDRQGRIIVRFAATFLKQNRISHSSLSFSFSIWILLRYMLVFLDILLTIVHLAIILFNLFGWVFRYTRKLHFVFIVLTAASWFILGIWYGMGYCPVTEWQWNVKEDLGERNLPSNFIEYFAEKITGYNFS